MFSPDPPSSAGDSATPVTKLRLSSFILDTVAKRRRPSQENEEERAGGRVLLKLDVEGAEVEVVADLLATGAASKVDRMLVEWHEDPEDEDRSRHARGLKRAAETLSYLTRKLGLEETVDVVAFDDETYYDQQLSLSGCD